MTLSTIMFVNNPCHNDMWHKNLQINDIRNKDTQHYNCQQNDIEYSNIQHKDASIIMLIVIMLNVVKHRQKIISDRIHNTSLSS